MAKIHILGGSGSGKTTLGQHLSSVLHIPHYDLDAIGMEKGLVTEEDAFAIAAQPAWVSEGVYLIKYREKVFIVRNRSDRERLLKFLTRDQ